MAAHGCPIGDSRDGEVGLISEFHGLDRRLGMVEDQIDVLFSSRRRETNGGGATAEFCLVRAELIAANREGREREHSCRVGFRLPGARNTFLFQSDRGIAYQSPGRVDDCAPDHTSVRVLGNRHRHAHENRDDAENQPKATAV